MSRDEKDKVKGTKQWRCSQQAIQNIKQNIWSRLRTWFKTQQRQNNLAATHQQMTKVHAHIDNKTHRSTRTLTGNETKG